jgi:hypothetical protein
MDMLKNSIDSVVGAIKNCQKLNVSATKDLIRQARRNSLQFSMQSFIDLYTFLNEISNLIDSNTNSLLSKTQQLKDLKNASQTCIKNIQDCIVANTTGNYLTRAKGLSIYFPQVYIDECYPMTDFAKNSSWMDVIKLALS